MSSFVSSIFGGTGNPLKRGVGGGRNGTTYEGLNRDAGAFCSVLFSCGCALLTLMLVIRVFMIALRVAETFLESTPEPSLQLLGPRPFIYLSAEDIFRPIIPARYIETKREAEAGLESMIANRTHEYRGVYIRPSAFVHLRFVDFIHSSLMHRSHLSSSLPSLHLTRCRSPRPLLRRPCQTPTRFTHALESPTYALCRIARVILILIPRAILSVGVYGERSGATAHPCGPCRRVDLYCRG